MQHTVRFFSQINQLMWSICYPQMEQQTFNTGVKYSATPSAVPFTELNTLCIVLERINKKHTTKFLKLIACCLLGSINIVVRKCSSILLCLADILRSTTKSKGNEQLARRLFCGQYAQVCPFLLATKLN